VPRTTLAILAGVCLTASAFTFASAQSNTVKPVWPDEGPFKWAPRPTVSEITANDLRTRLYQFADDSMMGRRIGELGNYKGTAYIASEFKRLGLKPAGDNGTYFQEMPYGPIGFDIASLRPVSVVVQVEETSGGKYNSIIQVPGDAQPKSMDVSLLDMAQADDSKDNDNKLDLDQIKQVLFIDATGFIGGVTGTNSLLLGKVRATP